MSGKIRFLTAVLSLSILGAMVHSSLASDVPTLLVIPAKPSVVAFCTDVAMMIPMDIVSYAVGKKTNEPALTLRQWNDRTREWTKISLEAYRAGAVFGALPKRIILVGNNDTVKSASGGLGELSAVPTLDTMGLANGLNDAFTFSSSQWRYLANRYQLKLKDLNEDRRRYGKYGPPGGRYAVPMPKIEDEEPVKGPARLDLPPIGPAAPGEAATPPENK